MQSYRSGLTMPDAIRVAVVDDHPMLREGVVRTLGDDGDMDVVGTGASADDAVKIARQFLPDIMLIDMNMPGSGLSAIERISHACPAIKLIVLTVREDHDAVTAALKSGARGYVLKGVGGSELIDVIRSVYDGGSYVSPSLATRLLADFRGDDARRNPLSDLTAREEQILRLIGTGLSNKEIGAQLDLKEKTIKHYVTNILQKLQLRNRVEAALVARQHHSD